MRHRLLATVVALLALLQIAASPATRPATAPATKPVPLVAGDHRRTLDVGGRPRAYLVHVPPKYDPAKPTPVVLAFHGAMMNGAGMDGFTGLSAKADAESFVVVYPDGVGLGKTMLFFNATAEAKPDGSPDDVAFTAALLDDLATVVNVDPKRVFATGMSNGGMMSHRLAAELSGRIAAIAPVGGTLALPAINPKRPVPVLHIHGSADAIVPFDGPSGFTPATMKFRSVADTIDAWRKANGCEKGEPNVAESPDAAKDGTTIRTETYGPGTDGAEVVLVTVVGGGHTWPGRPPPVALIGKSTKNLSANDVIWEFFKKHPMK